jgi:hypothetical protein
LVVVHLVSPVCWTSPMTFTLWGGRDSTGAPMFLLVPGSLSKGARDTYGATLRWSGVAALLQDAQSRMSDRERSDVVEATRGGDTSLRMDDEVGATIQLWRAPNRIWPAFPTLVVVRAASRLRRERGPAIGEGGVVSVLLDGSKVGAISPKQIKVYQVSPGEHSLSLHFLGGLRRSRKLYVPLVEGEEKHFVCLLNAFGCPWPVFSPRFWPPEVPTPRGEFSVSRA